MTPASAPAVALSVAPAPANVIPGVAAVSAADPPNAPNATSAVPVGPSVVKLGGSLMGSDALDALLAAVVASPAPVVIVPGGGLFADAVRAAQSKLGFSDRLAHRLALDAMGAFGEVLAERLGAPTEPDAARAATLARAGRPVIWTPANWRDGAPGVAESWDLTSDSAALIVARTIGACGLVLVKSAEPVDAEAPGRLAADIVDAAFPTYFAGSSVVVRLLGPRDWPRLTEALADPDASIGRRVAETDFGQDAGADHAADRPGRTEPQA